MLLQPKRRSVTIRHTHCGGPTQWARSPISSTFLQQAGQQSAFMSSESTNSIFNACLLELAHVRDGLLQCQLWREVCIIDIRAVGEVLAMKISVNLSNLALLGEAFGDFSESFGPGVAGGSFRSSCACIASGLDLILWST